MENNHFLKSSLIWSLQQMDASLSWPHRSTGCGRGVGRFLHGPYLAWVGGGETAWPPFNNLLYAISVTMEPWSVQHRAFVVEGYLKNGDSVLRTQHLFQRHFHVDLHGPIPSRNIIFRCVQNLRLTASAANKSPPGRVRNVRTPQNIDRVRVAVIRSPRRSTRKQGAALRISDHSVRRILHLDLHVPRLT